jgi:hypothetical protein
VLVRGVLTRAVSGWYESRARRRGLPRSRTGAVAFVQRFDSAVRRNVHFHVGWLDGVYSHRLGGDVTWHEDEGVADADVAALVRRIAVRVQQALKKAGKWWGEGDAADAGDASTASGSCCSSWRRVR